MSSPPSNNSTSLQVRDLCRRSMDCGGSRWGCGGSIRYTGPVMWCACESGQCTAQFNIPITNPCCIYIYSSNLTVIPRTVDLVLWTCTFEAALVNYLKRRVKQYNIYTNVFSKLLRLPAIAVIVFLNWILLPTGLFYPKEVPVNMLNQ